MDVKKTFSFLSGLFFDEELVVEVNIFSWIWGTQQWIFKWLTKKRWKKEQQEKQTLDPKHFLTD